MYKLWCIFSFSLLKANRNLINLRKTEQTQMFIVYKCLLNCEKIVSVDTLLTRWHLMTWCNRFSFHKPTSVYRWDKYAAVKENINMRLHVKLRRWKKGKKAPLFACENNPPFPYNHLDSFTTLPLIPCQTKPYRCCKGRGIGERWGDEGKGADIQHADWHFVIW